MIRVALIVTALLSGHHHVTITKPDGGGYMTTQLPCGARESMPKVLCVDGLMVIRARFAHAQPQWGNTAHFIRTRRALIYNARGRLSGWVDWARPNRMLTVGSFVFSRDTQEVWQ